jgi:hypothetical protein
MDGEQSCEVPCPALHHIPPTLMHVDTPQHGSEPAQMFDRRYRAALLILAPNPPGLDRLAESILTAQLSSQVWGRIMAWTLVGEGNPSTNMT